MDFPLGSETINDYIKEYLSFNDFKNTYDCFTAELQAKTVSTKLINKKPIEDKPNAPRIYNFLKSDQDKTGKENALEANLFSLHDNYRKVVLAARNILSISIGMVDFLETHNEV